MNHEIQPGHDHPNYVRCGHNCPDVIAREQEAEKGTEMNYTPSTAVRTLVAMAGSHTKAAADNQTPALTGTYVTMREATVAALRQVVLAEMSERDLKGDWSEITAAASAWTDAAIADYLTKEA